MSEIWRQTQAPVGIRSKPRIQPEIIVRYATLPSIDLGSVLVTAEDACEYTPNTDDTLPAGENYYGIWGVVKYPLGDAGLILNITGSKGGSGSLDSWMTFLANEGIDQSRIGTGGYGWNSIISVGVDGGTANDWIHLWGIPDISQFTRLGYIQSFDMNYGNVSMPVPDGFDAQKAVIRQRRVTGFSFSRNYIDNDELMFAQGKEITMLLEYRPQGTGFVSEYFVFPKAVLSPSISNPDNALVISPYEGMSNNFLAYQPAG